MQYETDPGLIETKSMAIIDRELKPNHYSEEELSVVKRMIHTSGDFSYQEIINIKPGAVQSALSALHRGCSVVTDTKMALAGINKKVLSQLGCAIDNFVDHPDVLRFAGERGITRSMAAIDHAVESGTDIFVIGNAPTALFRLGELVESGRLSPALIIAVPVGFVGAAESKEYIRTLDVPSISTVGTKGGSNIAAAVLNAILYLEKP